MNIELKKIYEHDIDLLILEEFISDKAFASLFLHELGISDDYKLLDAMHSKSDANGESDITFILKIGDKRIGILVENKIDAPTMINQSQRYFLRGESGKKQGLYDLFYVMLVCPDAYYSEHKNDPNANYPYWISYEKLKEFFDSQSSIRAQFKKEVIDFAIAEKKNGYLVQEAETVTLFWKNLRSFLQDSHPTLTIVGNETPKGSSACWPEFRTSLGKIKVVYKSQKGCVDLEFPNYAERTGNLYAYIIEKTGASFKIVETGKSASVRMQNAAWVCDFSRPFDTQLSSVEGALQAVETLCSLADKLNYCDLY